MVNKTSLAVEEECKSMLEKGFTYDQITYKMGLSRATIARIRKGMGDFKPSRKPAKVEEFKDVSTIITDSLKLSEVEDLKLRLEAKETELFLLKMDYESQQTLLEESVKREDALTQQVKDKEWEIQEVSQRDWDSYSYQMEQIQKECHDFRVGLEVVMANLRGISCGSAQTAEKRIAELLAKCPFLR